MLVEGYVRDSQQEVISTDVHHFKIDVLKVCHLRVIFIRLDIDGARTLAVTHYF